MGKYFSVEDICEYKEFVASFLERYRERITIENYVRFYIFACPYNGDSGMWTVQFGVNPHETLYCDPKNSLRTRIDFEFILESFKNVGAKVTMPDDYLWMVTRPL